MILIFILFIFVNVTNDALAWQTPNITNIRFGTHPDYTRVAFDLNTKLSYRVDKDADGSIFVDFPRGIISPKLMHSKNTVIKVNDNVIDKIKIEKIGKGVRAKIILGQKGHSFKNFLLKKPYRLIIDVQKSKISRTRLQKKKKDHKIEVIIIDPGHGGKDPGAIGRRGLKEKIIVLDIAKRTEKLLNRSRKVKVILTRHKDKFVSLDNRVKIANKNSGDLFVSIHTNAHLHKSAGGFETFYLGEPKTAEARSVAVLENSVMELEERPFLSDLGRTLDKILWDLRLNEFRIESKELAGVVQENLDKRLSLRNRGIKGSLFYVLKGAAMPAILVETAFISNPREEALLRSSSFRQSIAQAICTSILQYKDTLERTRGFTD